MSKRDINDRDTYTFCRIGTSHYSHGRITFNYFNNFTKGKEITCPECNHEFLWEKQFAISPRYSKAWYEDPERNVDNIPHAFSVVQEINTPSKGDPFPRISFLVYGAKLTWEDRVPGRRPEDNFAIRSHEDHGVQLNVLEMNKGNGVKNDDGNY